MPKIFVHRQYGSTKLAKPLILDEQAQAHLANEHRRREENEQRRRQHRAERLAATAKYRAELRELTQELRALPKKHYADFTCYEPELVEAVASVKQERLRLKNPQTDKLFSSKQMAELKVANRFLTKFAIGDEATCYSCGCDITSKTFTETRVPYEVVIITINKRMFVGGLCKECMELPQDEKTKTLAKMLFSWGNK